LKVPANGPASPARSAVFIAVAVILVVSVAVVVGLLYRIDRMYSGGTSTIPTVSSSSPAPISTTSSTSTSTNSTLSGVTVILPEGATYQVSSSFDCVAGNSAQPFNVTAPSRLEGGITAGGPGVTLYVSTAQDAQTLNEGHPTAWIYTSGLTNSTNFTVALAPGSYVLWTEGADMGCGATIVEPLEELTTVTVTQAVTVAPSS
jgi:hypothetical protein